MSQGFTASGNGFDMLSTLCSAENAITGATTALISKMNVCNSGASYAVTLPAATGNTGKICGIRIKEAVTGLITLTCTGAEKLYGSGDNVGSATRLMWRGESALLLSDGANWYKIAGQTIPMLCTIYDASASRNYNSGAGSVTWTTAVLGTVLIDNSGQMGLTANTITIKRPGQYKWGGAAKTFNNPSTLQRALAYFDVNAGTAITFPNAGTYEAPDRLSVGAYYDVASMFVIPVTRAFAASDALIMKIGLQTSAGAACALFQPAMSVEEVPTW